MTECFDLKMWALMSRGGYCDSRAGNERGGGADRDDLVKSLAKRYSFFCKIT